MLKLIKDYYCRIAYLTVLLTLVGCGKLNMLGNDPKIDVVKDSNRIVKNFNQVVGLRPLSGASNSYITTIPDFENIASVLPPDAPTSYGVAQATSVALDGNYIYISYNTEGAEVYGAIDIINISDVNNPVIDYTYTSADLEFADLKIKGNHLYLVGGRKETSTQSGGSILMVLDVTSKSTPVVKSVQSLQGRYGTSIDLEGNKILVTSGGSTGALLTFDISNPDQPTLISSVPKTNPLFSTIGKSLDYSLLGKPSTTFQAITKNVMEVGNSSIGISSSISEAPSRFARQNSLLYTNNSGSRKLHVLDLSHVLRGDITEIASIPLEGTSNSLAHDQQKLYLAQGESGVFVVNVENPSSPELLGNMKFTDEDGSANNLWIDNNYSGKFLFVASGLKGVKILKQAPKAKVPSNQISFYARGMDYTGQAQVVVKVNGTVVETIPLVGSQYQLYTVDYSSVLSPTDVVDLVFINDKNDGTFGQDRNAMVAYLKVNDNFCYVDKSVNGEDLGLMDQMQVLSATQETCSNYAIPLLCSAGADKVPAESCPVAGNRIGKLVCDSSSMGYTCQNTGVCQSGFVDIAGTCTPIVCTANIDTQDCSDSISVKQQVCNTLGTGYGSCEFVSCQPTYLLIGGSCVPQVCSPNSVASCSDNNGDGTKTCNSDGSSYGSCQITSCDSGYYLSNGSCVPQVCNPHSTQNCSFMNLLGTQSCNAEGSAWDYCQTGTTCEAGYYYSMGMCLPQVCSPNSSASCSGTNGSGSQTCNSEGSGYGSCQLSSCDSGFYLSGNTCIAQTCSPNATQSCVENHLIGTRTCDSQGSAWGSCQTGTTCEAGFYYDNGSCVAQVCSPNSTASCNESNGLGTKTCNSEGSSYGSCVITSCNSGFYLDNGACIAQVCSPSSTQSCVENHLIGSQTCSGNGSAWGSCQTGTTCEAGFYYNGGSCVAQGCNPNETVSCFANNGSGSQTCDALGSSYGSCQLSSCDSGFYMSGGSCLAQVCSPNSSSSCSVVNGTGTKQCNSEGSSYGSCSLVSCDPGFYNNGGTCTAQVCSPSSTQSCVENHLIGTRTCDSQGSAWGSCQTGTTCEAGFYYNGGSCHAQVCSPNSSSSCAVANGTGSHTCNAEGSAYGSCSTVSCNSGYYNNNGTCTAQVCSPSSTQSCVENHLIGSQTCNSEGSAYGSCQTGTTCEAGFYYNNGACHPQACSPNSTTSCSQGNGTGTKQCNSQGSAYGSCTITTCNSGYNLVGGTCVAQVCSPNSTASCSQGNGTGTKTCSSDGMSYGACQINACNSGYYLNNGSCHTQVCTPNATTSCSIQNGTGTQTCNSNGSAQGSCTVASCNSGYHVESNTCESNTQTCSVPNGSGTMTSGDIELTHQLDSDWGSGYTYSVNLKNTSQSNLTDWVVCFSLNKNVGNNNLWNAELGGSKPNWRLTPKSYNKTINPGSDNPMGWQASSGGLGSLRISNIKVYKNNPSGTCSGTQVSISTCVANTCNQGYHLQNGQCVAN